jgi:transporter family protein
MWLLLAFLSAALLGFYDAFKKKSLRDNAVLPVLFLNTVFSSLIFLPFILISAFTPALNGTMFEVPVVGWEVHKFIIVKSFIVLSSWIFGYFGMKHLPLTIVGPINATRPVMVLVGAMLIFGERLNLYQWIGVMLAILSFFMLSRSGKKEGIDFKHNKWIYFIVLAAITGAISGLYDKYLMKQFNPMAVQSWYNVYQVFIMCPIILLLWYPKRKESTPFRWDWTIILISIFLSAADFAYTDHRGKRQTLHGTPAPRLLLLFYDPACSHCAEILDALQESPALTRLIAAGELAVLAAYTEGDRRLWDETKAALPQEWTVGIDNSRIVERELYSLPAMPVIYLLDKDKRVLLKDSSPAGLEAFLSPCPK